MEHTGGEGAHVVVDSISGPGSMASAHACVRPGGTIACLGMDHFMGKTPSVNWFDQFLRNISVTGGLVPGKRYFPEFQLFQMFVKDPDGLTIELNFHGMTTEPKYRGTIGIFSRWMYSQTSSSVQLESGKTRMFSCLLCLPLYRFQSSGRWFLGSHWP